MCQALNKHDPHLEVGVELFIHPLIFLEVLLSVGWDRKETQVLTSEVLSVPGEGCVRGGLARGGVHGKQA